ncbi:dTDP-glucose 4,6-dehydratase [Prochlorococcus marinus str. NATL2A]|uniref:dTDP-glucose 4,6-dehydratase n=1 Tax=Prochlorococcus marinus (strain NATL2A) TaxID=59920 RepID=Q46IF2_PROMT|nr:dTDP-glucose 4,6-dehydratase [Prochlorococcus marinus]AAZ58726.1 dTDP-glucose 4,6-dehydratase [Prochlorococcus marinus str. NATL2A]
MNLFPENINSILITGGSGFIGTNLISRLLRETTLKIYNLDKINYASNLKVFDEHIDSNKYHFLNVDLFNIEDTKNAIRFSNPDLVFHLAAESHVDKSISKPKDFLDSNIIGTFNLLQELRTHWELMSINRQNSFRLIHVSTDEVFGSIKEGFFFSETTSYDPRSPYSATKAASDHLVKAWSNTYGFPAIITNSCNNFGPWQYPEKLIPVIINNALNSKSIPLYGNGQNVRDWIFVEDHVDALIQVMLKGRLGDSYCIGSRQLKTNEEIVNIVCDYLDLYKKSNAPHIRFKKFVKDRAGHDLRYAIDNNKIINELKWSPKYDFYEAIDFTVRWYLDNQNFLSISD